MRGAIADHQCTLGADVECGERARVHLRIGLLDPVLEREHVHVDVIVETVPHEVRADVVVDIADDRDEDPGLVQGAHDRLGVRERVVRFGNLVVLRPDGVRELVVELRGLEPGKQRVAVQLD